MADMLTPAFGPSESQRWSLLVSPIKIGSPVLLSLIHISEPTRRTPISYAVFCLQKKSDSRRLRVLFRVSSVLNQVTAGLDLERILPEVLRTCVAALQADTGSLFVLSHEYELEHAHMLDRESGFLSAKPDYLQHIMRTGLASKVINTGEPILIGDTNSDQRWLSEGPKAGVSMSAMCIPLKAVSYTHLTLPTILLV